MGAPPTEEELATYQGADFQKISSNMIQDAKAELKQSQKNVQEISSIPFKVSGSKKYDLKDQMTALKKVLSNFERDVAAAKSGKLKSAKDLDALYIVRWRLNWLHCKF